MLQRKTEELRSLSNSEKVSLKRLYSSGRAAYGSVQNLSKASGLSKKSRTIFTNQEIVYNIYHNIYWLLLMYSRDLSEFKQ